MDYVRQYGTINKVEARAEGLYVAGIASTEARDKQGEIVKASAMRKALARYFTRSLTGEVSGPVREMHQMSAVGKTIAAEVTPDGATHVECVIVDPVAQAKVRAGIYKGFSIGGRVPPGGRNKADPTVVEALILTELSLVDAPANPQATFSVFKVDRAAGALAKVSAERDDAIAKLGVLRGSLRKVSAERDGLRDQLRKAAHRHAGEIAAVRAEADAFVARAATKGALKAVAVGKAEDTAGLSSPEAPEPEDAFALIKRAHRAPGTVRLRGLDG